MATAVSAAPGCRAPSGWQAPELTTIAGWPFWAPSDLSAVEAALDLASVRPGEHVVDLGCGDGQVLVAAARRGCRVTGVECDADLAARARIALAENGLSGEVIEGDVFDFPIATCDVVFSYLAPATLQQLRPRLDSVPGLRVVTVDFAIPDAAPVVESGANRLYVMPSTPAEPRKVGWRSAGVVVGVVPDRHSLTCLLPVAPAGEVDVWASGDLPASLTLEVGARHVPRRASVAVDIRWDELPEGTFRTGALHLEGVGALAVFALVTDSEDGLWEVSRRGVRNLSYRIALDRTWVPSSFAELLAACEA